MIHRTSQVLVACAAVAVGSSLQATDWPRWRGSDDNGISTETGWLGQWGNAGPKQLWTASVGTGFSSFAVSQGRVFTMGHNAGKDTVFCFDASRGKELWTHSYDAKLDDHYYEGGPNATPTVDGDRVYTFGKRGQVRCLKVESGEVVWSKDVHSEFGLAIPEWGFAGSPFVEGDLLILNAGTHGIALAKATGAKAWISGTAAAGYATPVPFMNAGKRALAIFAAKAVVAVDPKTGRELWRHPWKTSYDVHATDPLVQGETMFLSSGYGTGGGAIQFSGGKPRALWTNKELRTHMSGGVILDGYIYAIDGSGDEAAKLKCLELKTGEVRWATPVSKTGTLTAADNKLIVLSGDGNLLVSEAKPDGYKELARAQIIGGKCWTPPVLANGRLYARNARGKVVCIDVKGGSEG